MRALSIRQPYAEMILRGIKTVEYRSRPTRLIGERFYIYASKGKSSGVSIGGRKVPVWSHDLTVPSEPLAPWMTELAELLILGKLPTGVIVGSAVIERVTPKDEHFEWHLAGVERATELRKPVGHPQPVWFRPF